MMNAEKSLSDAMSRLHVVNNKKEDDEEKGLEEDKKGMTVLAGMDEALDSLREAVLWPTKYAKDAETLGVKWPRGVLLHGPPGTGKTSAVLAIASECDAILHTVTIGRVLGAYVGESERNLREIFAKAEEDVRKLPERPVIVFLDDIDALCPRRGKASQHDARIVGQLLTLLDGVATGGAGTQRRAVVMATTSRPNAIDPALRRPGRLDREVAVRVPDPGDRQTILRLLADPLPLARGVDLGEIASKCHGYTGADLRSLCKEASITASMRASEEGGTTMVLTHNDFLDAVKRVKASVIRGVAREFLPASWDDIGGLDEPKRLLKRSVEWPLQHKAALKRMNLRPPRGVLLHGPPGCAKTTLARAAVTASGATFIPLQGAALYSMYVGEGEGELREAFRRGRLAAPSIIFLDELDMLVGSRGAGGSDSGGNDVSARLLSTLLNEMDGLGSTEGILVLATTNRPGAIDTALLRPGRFDMTIYVPPPDATGRHAALTVHTRRMPLSPDVDLAVIAAKTEGYTGAELAAVCREAAMAALREDVEEADVVAERHFLAALDGVRPALTTEALAKYEAWPPR